jgi:large subunit ribosomal protein L10
MSSDAITSAKNLTKFAKTNNKLKIVAGFMDGKVLDQKEVAIIATLPSLEEARAKIVGILAAPAQKLVSILLAPGSKIANLARAKSLKN